MLDRFRQLRLCVITLVLVTLSLGIGDKASLCIMPDGDVHLEQDHATCGPAGMGSAASNPALHDDQVESRAHCLDVSLEVNASNRHHRDAVRIPAPAAIFQEPPLIFAPAASTAPGIISAAPPQQLLSLRSIVLLI